MGRGSREGVAVRKFWKVFWDDAAGSVLLLVARVENRGGFDGLGHSRCGHRSPSHSKCVFAQSPAGLSHLAQGQEDVGRKRLGSARHLRKGPAGPAQFHQEGLQDLRQRLQGQGGARVEAQLEQEGGHAHRQALPVRVFTTRTRGRISGGGGGHLDALARFVKPICQICCTQLE